jgi:hypothetical protein
MPSTVEIVGEVSPMRQPANLGKILLDAIDERLPVPGEIVRTAIYERLERSYQIRREETPDFRPSATGLLGTSAKNLHNNLGSPINEDDNWKLIDYVNRAGKAQVSV